MALVDSGFRPSEHGWPFSHALTFPSEALGLPAPPPPAGGLPGGHCWAALDRFLEGRRIPRNLAEPGAGDALQHELLRRQAAVLATGLWARVRALQALPERDGLLGRGAEGASRAEWARIRRA
ncbi:MAG TPA: hypothetical protein VMK65_11315, partial [Longimicrobiales bacterium]|nr:hypothetical protein [Longimicrobiales bacterium]